MQTQFNVYTISNHTLSLVMKQSMHWRKSVWIVPLKCVRVTVDTGYDKILINLLFNFSFIFTLMCLRVHVLTYKCPPECAFDVYMY